MAHVNQADFNALVAQTLYDFGQLRLFRPVHRGPPLFNKADLDREKWKLMNEFTHFIFHENKRFYKPMDKIIDFADKDPLLVEFSRIHPPPLPADMNLARWDYVKACSPVQINHLRLFNRPERQMPARYARSFRRAVAHVGEMLKLKNKLPMPTKESLLSVRYDGRKFAGLDYARQKLKNRDQAHSVALADAQIVWDALHRGQRVAPHDTRLGGKGKLIEKDSTTHGLVDPELNTLPMGRLILMLSHRDLLILGAIEQPLTKSYLDPIWPINVGQSWYHGGAEAFVKKLSKYAQFHCFDAKRFDAAVDGWLVKEALLILREQFEDGLNSRYDTLWAFVYESLVEVIICRDDGIRMQKKVGTTSGNCFNTLVQSIITMMLGYTALAEKAFERHGTFGVELVLSECELEVLGDDMVMSLMQPWAHLTKEGLSEVVKDCFNIDWSGKKSFSTTSLLDEPRVNSPFLSLVPGPTRFKGIQFLGAYFRRDRWGSGPTAREIIVPYRPFRESYLSLLFPKYGVISPAHSWLRAIGVYLNAAGNDETRLWLEEYLTYLEGLDFEQPQEWPESMEKMVTRDFWSLGIEVPKPARITKEEWLRITCVPHPRVEE